ncbi:MAG: hypothetical protein GX594_05885 [Pirellulaceae bacterium]|nr:hypothetical protein [Pirellulaceae bacterium]
MKHTEYRRGQLVTVRNLQEILATLDCEGKYDGLPFMPEMAPLCGMTFRVHRRAEKTCVEGLGMRGMRDAVLLEGPRCDGSAHDGCQRGCMFFWKEVWLKPADLSLPFANHSEHQAGADRHYSTPSQTEDTLTQELMSRLPVKKDNRYFCQSTELGRATTDFTSGKLKHFIRDLLIGELSPRRFAYFLWMSLKNRICRLVTGRYCNQPAGNLKQTTTEELNLKPGELVQIKTLKEIEDTLDAQGRNRGLTFEPEMAMHCGRRYRVSEPLNKIIVEATGEMVQLKNTVVLDGLVCQGLCVKNCPRANYLYWREIWLRRV